jgi:hypothetical protein
VVVVPPQPRSVDEAGGGGVGRRGESRGGAARLREEEERRRVAVVHVGKKTTEGVTPSPYRATGRVIGGVNYKFEPICHIRGQFLAVSLYWYSLLCHHL